MKNRLHDVPVKIIQILPVDNEPAKQPLKPQDFSSFVKRLSDASRRTTDRWTMAANWVASKVRQWTFRFSASKPPEMDDRINVEGPPILLSRYIDSRHIDLPALTGHEAPLTERVDDIVVRDLAILPGADSLEKMEAASAALPPEAPWRSRLDAAKTAIVARWLQEKEQIAAIKAAAVAQLRPCVEAMRESWSHVRLAVLRQGTTVARIVDGRVDQVTTQMTATKMRGRRKIAHELAHELEVTKATLLAQQQALENASVQLNAVQKELARHKSLLADLMTHVEAVDMKIVQSAQTASSRKSRLASEGGPPRRSATKKTGLGLERSREHRA